MAKKKDKHKSEMRKAGTSLKLNLKVPAKKEVKKPVVSRTGKLIKSFIAVGDVIEVLHYGEKGIYKVEEFEVVMNSLYVPTQFVIYVKFSYNEGASSIECTSDSFRYIRHISHCL